MTIAITTTMAAGIMIRGGILQVSTKASNNPPIVAGDRLAQAAS